MKNRPDVEFLSGGSRLHLQHGPIDLIIGADGNRFNAFFAAQKRFDTALQSLVDELDILRLPLTQGTPEPSGPIAKTMHDAALPFCQTFLTRMVCVAGSVADTVLEAMKEIHPLDRAYVNNGGDIALHLTPDTKFDTAIMGHDNQILGMLKLSHSDGVGGIATSGRHGRSQSMGIADAVTVLAKDAATADVAATLIANQVDLPGHSIIRRQPADLENPESDLGHRNIVTDCGQLTSTEIGMALDRGADLARELIDDEKIIDAALFLQGHSRIMRQGHITSAHSKRTIEHV
jgi:ApbE superfamily uncharacterized protein (UPF0280 family)